MKIGYARVSTDDQTLDLQRDALKKAKCREIYEEHASGKNTVRPQLEACLKSLREGDALIVWRPHPIDPGPENARHRFRVPHRANRHSLANWAAGVPYVRGARRI
jgi:hypothetical protein